MCSRVTFLHRQLLIALALARLRWKNEWCGAPAGPLKGFQSGRETSGGS